MEKTCGNCEWLEKYVGELYFCARHLDDYHEESDMACEDWRYGEQMDIPGGNAGVKKAEKFVCGGKLK